VLSRAQPPGPARPAPHVLVVRADNAGDVLLSGPATRAVAARAGRLTYLCGPRGEEAARMLPGVDAVVRASLSWIVAEPAPTDRRGTLQLVERLTRLAVDEAVILTSFHQSPLPLALVLRMAGVGRISATSVDYPGSLLDVRVHPDDELHEVERGLRLAEAAGFPLPAGDDRRLRVRLPAGPEGIGSGVADGIGAGSGLADGIGAGATPGVAAGVAVLGDLAAGLDRPYVVVHPGASVPARAWAPERMAALVAALDRRGWGVVVTGAPSERRLTAAVAGVGSGAGSGVVDAGGRTSLVELAQLLTGAAALVTGNTGPAHLAAATGTPVVSLYAPTVPAHRWRPWMVPHVLLGNQLIACRDCRARHCPVPGHPCIDEVTVDTVVDAVAELAGAAPTLTPSATEAAG